MPESPDATTGSVLSPRGLLDTSVLIDLPAVSAADLPAEAAISAISVAELAAGPHASEDEAERSRRQDRLQWVVATWNPLPFDADAARAYGRVYAATRAAGRSSRTRLADLLIAATAAATDLPIYTRNVADFDHLDEVVTVVGI